MANNIPTKYPHVYNNHAKQAKLLPKAARHSYYSDIHKLT